jgi:phosphohistidine phosphatase
LLLLRHAEAGNQPSGGRDIDRQLTARGERQAREVGAFLREQDLRVDHALCSSAARAQQTLAALQLSLPASNVRVSEDYYNAGADTLIEALRTLPAGCAVALLVAHAPGLPGVAFALADPRSSDPAAMAALERRFPAAALARLSVAGRWADLAEAALVSIRMS